MFNLYFHKQTLKTGINAKRVGNIDDTKSIINSAINPKHYLSELLSSKLGIDMPWDLPKSHRLFD